MATHGDDWLVMTGGWYRRWETQPNRRHPLECSVPALYECEVCGQHIWCALPPPSLPPSPFFSFYLHRRLTPQAEKISPNDLAVFDDEALPNQWSRRVHALERVADRVAVTNRFPAYAEYSSEGRHRHLFQVRL